MGQAYVTWVEGIASQVLGFDAILSETHELMGEATSHPVEDGSDIVDHVHINPEVVTLEVYVTNQPITNVDSLGNITGHYEMSLALEPAQYDPSFVPTPGAVFSAIGNAVKSLFNNKAEYSAKVLQFDRKLNYTSIMQEQLWKLIKERTLVTVVTGTRTYENMLLISAPASRKPDLGDAVTFQLAFHQLRIISAKSAVAAKEIIAKPKVEKGQKSPKEEEEETSVSYRLKHKGLK